MGEGWGGTTLSKTVVSDARYQEVLDTAVTAYENNFLSSTILPWYVFSDTLLIF
jgi:hypothetical protein